LKTTSIACSVGTRSTHWKPGDGKSVSENKPGGYVLPDRGHATAQAQIQALCGIGCTFQGVSPFAKRVLKTLIRACTESVDGQRKTLYAE
jgi:hypothetical protein